MEIAEAVTSDFAAVDQGTPVSKLMGTFRERRDATVVVEHDDEFAGVVTRKELLASKHEPDEKARTVMRRDPPRLGPQDDVREVARLMVESDLDMLPVFEADRFTGVVTDHSLVAAVEPHLDALDVADVYSGDLVDVRPDTTVGKVIHRLREEDISRVPVVDDEAVGMISYHDLLGFTVRQTDRMQGGSPDGFDGHGGSGSRDGYRSHGGFGDRAGEQARLLDLPARDVMNAPVVSAGPEESLQAAADRMLENEYSSLVVELPGAGVGGILTTTDVVRSLTWTGEEETTLQIFGVDLLTDTTTERVAEMVDAVADKHARLDVQGTYVVLQDHKESLRGTPLVRATIRMFTDRGQFAGTGEEYGAAPALRTARDRLERNVLDDKDRARVQKAKSPEKQAEIERLLGWWLEA